MSKNIKGYQLVIILYLCRSYTFLTHNLGNADFNIAVYSIIFSVFIQFAFLVPAYFLYKRYKSTNIITISQQYSSSLAKIIALICSIFFLMIVFDTLTSFYSFVTNTVFPYAPQYTIIIPIFLVVLYAVMKGFNPILRTAEMIFPLTIIILVIITAVAIKEINFIYWKPILESPVITVTKAAFLISFRNLELVPMIYLLDQVPTRKKTTILNYTLLFAITFEIRILTVLLVLGDYAKIQLYPSYSVASLVEASIFQRLDSIYTIVWVFMAFIKLAFYLWLSVDLLNQSFSKKNHRYILPLVSILLLVATVWKNTIFTTQVLKVIFFIISGLFILILIFIPVVLLLLHFSKNRRTKS